MVWQQVRLMSAASLFQWLDRFIHGYDGSVYLMWTGDMFTALVALFKKGGLSIRLLVIVLFTIARVVAVICTIFISFTYVAGQMRGVGIVFSF